MIQEIPQSRGSLGFVMTQEGSLGLVGIPQSGGSLGLVPQV